MMSRCVRPRLLLAVLLALSPALVTGTAEAQDCKPTSRKDKITKVQEDEWGQDLYKTGALGSAVAGTAEVSIRGAIARVGDENRLSLALTKSESNPDRAVVESGLKAEKGKEFLFGFKEGGEPLRFKADSVSNNTRVDLFGNVETEIVIYSKISDEDLKPLREALANRQIDAVRIALANDMTIDRSIKSGNGKKFAEKLGCFFAFAEKSGFMTP